MYCAKRKHATEEEAKTKALKLGRRWYWCVHCRAYHLTSQEYRGKKKTPEFKVWNL